MPTAQLDQLRAVLGPKLGRYLAALRAFLCPYSADDALLSAAELRGLLATPAAALAHGAFVDALIAAATPAPARPLTATFIDGTPLQDAVRDAVAVAGGEIPAPELAPLLQCLLRGAAVVARRDPR